MVKRRPFGWKKGVIPAVILAGALFAIASVHGATDPDNMRPDVLMIDLPTPAGGERMPAVQFLHDLHTEHIQEKKNCRTCHLEKDGKFVFRFMRLDGGTTETDMAIYHENCIGCHVKTAAAGKKAGPTTGDCRSCHKTQPEMGSSRQPVSFDKSLHYRHESAAVIRPKNTAGDDNCSACHHTWDKILEKTVYTKGQEGSCTYCHREEQTGKASSIRRASHDACINCHWTLSGEGKKAGPTNCAGCHGVDAQAALAKVTSVPRMKRNQPDVVLLAGWMTNRDMDAQKAARWMNPVPFNHEIHEQANATCRSCHHQDLKPCGECHTETGKKEGGQVQLARAMHDAASARSCIGCHKEARKEKDCAGCHAGMPDRPFAGENCDQCHRIDRSALGPWPMSKAAETEVAAAALKTRRGIPEKPADDQIPEKVVIDTLANRYEGAQFPHRRVYRALESHLAGNKLAEAFHDEQTTLCMGCHHHSPATFQPPRCASCHGEAFKSLAEDGRPGLMGAYHGQCIRCHQEMGMEEPAPTDCGKCHKEKIAVSKP